MADLKVVEIKKDTKQKEKAKSFDKTGYVKKAKKKKETPPYVKLLQGDQVFLKACQLAGLPFPQRSGKTTRRGGHIIDHSNLGLVRQYGKWRNKKGIAYAHRNEVMLVLDNEL